MGFTVAQTYLSDILHVVSQSLLAPDIILLLAFILYALFCIGSVIAEYFTERRHFKVVMPKFLAALMASKEEDIPLVIEHSGLLNRQKEALNTVYEYRALPGDALVALVRRLVGEEETRYDRITGRNNMAAKVSPMLGLMGTLIPLGPGIQALGTADTAALSASLLVAFDTTVAGLVTAAICLVVGKIRSNWYNNYLSALDAAMATMMEKIEDGRETSTATLPEGAESYKFLFDVKDEPEKESFSASAADETPANEAVSTSQVTAPLAAAAAVQATEQLQPVDAASVTEPIEAVQPADEPSEVVQPTVEPIETVSFDMYGRSTTEELPVQAAEDATQPIEAAEAQPEAQVVELTAEAEEATEPMPAVEEVAEVAAEATDAAEAEVVVEDAAEATDTVETEAADAAEAETEVAAEEQVETEAAQAAVFKAPAQEDTKDFNFAPAKDPVKEDKPSWML